MRTRAFADHQRYLREITSLPELEAAWLLLLFTAAPRSAHLLRTLPPSQSTPYAIRHDDLGRDCCLAHNDSPMGYPLAPAEPGFPSHPIGRLGGRAARPRGLLCGLR